MDILVPVTITDTILNSSSIAENDYSAWSSLTSYVVDDLVIVTTPNVHKIYICRDANSNKYPPDNIYNSEGPTGYWSLVSATNRWKMFDNKVESKSTDSSPMVVELEPGVLTNGITLFGIVADAVNVTVERSSVEIYNKDVDLKDLSGIFGYYDWFFSPISNKPTIVLTDLPAYTDSVITVTLTRASGNIELGQLSLSRKYDIGDMQQGSRLSKRTFSVKEIDTTDGYATIDVDKTAKTIDYIILLKSNKVTYIDRLLEENFNVPVVFIGDENVEWTQIFSFIKDYVVTLNDGNYVKYSLQAEELV